MNPEEYEKLSNIEGRHWFYVGKREIVRSWLNRCARLKSADVLVDCGAGTGRFVQEMLPFCNAIALDDHAESLTLARARLGIERVKQGPCTALPFGDASVDAITALDVLEHIKDDYKAVAEFARVLKPGGVLIITVPALPSLWSDWDVVLHHQRRYTKRSLLALLNGSPFRLEHWNYVNVLALPAVWLLRKWRGGKPPANGDRSEDKIPPEPLNAILKWQFIALAKQRLIRFPAGVGLLAVLRKE